jgi:hypothetical protein
VPAVGSRRGMRAPWIVERCRGRNPKRGALGKRSRVRLTDEDFEEEDNPTRGEPFGSKRIDWRRRERKPEEPGGKTAKAEQGGSNQNGPIGSVVLNL